MININGVLYMQGMWNEGLGNIVETQIWKSTDNRRYPRAAGLALAARLAAVFVLAHNARGDGGDLFQCVVEPPHLVPHAVFG
nr:Uncharacterised protein [Streptococcus thermophilus]